MRILLVMLIALGLAAPAATARGASPSPAAVTAADSYRTDVIFLAHMPQKRAIALWEKILGPAGEARIIVGRAGTVVVYDTPPRLARFRALVEALDSGDASAHIYLRAVVHLPPSALADLIARVLGDAGGEGRLVLVPDDRSGQLLVRTTPERYRVVDRLARRLDVPAGDRQRALRTLTGPSESDQEAP
ncbi:MAG: hypothetical protein EP329_27525 [Deltaproteobacteria bacterium]|nr:MAG: hypothetical protein EP329_27525 [Deltaproteobacteria bacterium]